MRTPPSSSTLQSWSHTCSGVGAPGPGCAHADAADRRQATACSSTAGSRTGPAFVRAFGLAAGLAGVLPGGRPAPEQVRFAATFVGLALIGSLMLFVIYLDVKRLWF